MSTPSELRTFLNFLRRPIIGPLSLNGLLALAGIAGPVLLLVADAVAARSSLDNNYSLTRDAISLLAWMPMGWIQTIGFLAIGLLVEVFTAGLLLGIRGGRRFGVGIALLVCFGFGLLLIGAFHTDIPGRESTIDGAIHGAAASTVFWLLPVAVLLIAPSLKKDAYWRPLSAYSVTTAVLALVWILIYKIWLPADLSWFGLYERILVVTEVLWVEVMGIWLLRLSLKRAVPPPAPGTTSDTP